MNPVSLYIGKKIRVPFFTTLSYPPFFFIKQTQRGGFTSATTRIRIGFSLSCARFRVHLPKFSVSLAGSGVPPFFRAFLGFTPLTSSEVQPSPDRPADPFARKGAELRQNPDIQLYLQLFQPFPKKGLERVTRPQSWRESPRDCRCSCAD